MLSSIQPSDAASRVRFCSREASVSQAENPFNVVLRVLYSL